MNREDVLRLIAKGEDLLAKENKDIDGERFASLDQHKYSAWKTQSLTFLKKNLTQDGLYYLAFYNQVGITALHTNAERGLALLNSLLEDIDSNQFDNSSHTSKPVFHIYNIFDRFNIVARQLRNRYDNRCTLNVKDEYDVQDLLHSLLKLHFDNVKPEDGTSGFAGKSSRLDFFLPDHEIVIEAKKSSASLTEKKLGDQIIIDIARYKQRADCKSFLCFVYDPDGFVSNRTGFENDLNKLTTNDFIVEVFVRPIF